MAEQPQEKVTLEELVVSTLAMTDALAKLMIAKGIITDDEFKAQLETECFAVLNHHQQPPISTCYT